MTNDRKPHAHTIAPGEPGAPVSGHQPGPAPATPTPGTPPADTGHPARSGGHAGAHARPEPRRAPATPATNDGGAGGAGGGAGGAGVAGGAAGVAGGGAGVAGGGAGVAGGGAEPMDANAGLTPGADTEPLDDYAGPIVGARPAPTIELAELTAKAQRADEYLELAQRTKADFENYRKRAVREAAAAQERGVAKLARELLPAVDNLDRALAAAEGAAAAGVDGDDTEATLVSGIKLVHAEVLAALARAGIEPYSPRGEQFDPQWHEAVAQQPFEGVPAGTIVEVYQPGYRLGDTVLRPARVVVAG